MIFPSTRGVISVKFEEKLMALRKKTGMSQEELADRLGVSRQAISRWELGSTLPDAPNLLKLSDLFGVSIDYLLRDDYESERDLPPAQEMRREMTAKDQKNRRLFLVASIAFMIAAAAFLIAAIDRMSIHLVGLVFADALLSLIFLWKYCKTEPR